MIIKVIVTVVTTIIVGAGGTAVVNVSTNTSVNVSPGYAQNQCKNGGWKNFGDMFKNQGQCLKFFK
jgi:hypothetical protein